MQVLALTRLVSALCESARLTAQEALMYRGTPAERSAARAAIRESLKPCHRQAMLLYAWKPTGLPPRKPGQPDWGQRNFGDEANCDVFRALIRQDRVAVTHVANPPISRRLERPGKVLLIGTVLKSAQPHDVVVGAGAQAATRPLPAATFVHSVRGLASIERIGRQALVGDPALYAWLLVPSWFDLDSRGGDGLCILPNGADTDLKEFAQSAAGVKHISHDQSPTDVARLVAGCDILYSSSLHGLIFADALGVPSVVPSDLPYNPFKVVDYLTAIANSTALLDTDQTKAITKMTQIHLRDTLQVDAAAFIADDCKLHGQRVLPRLSFQRRLDMALAYVRSFPMAKVCYSTPADLAAASNATTHHASTPSFC